MVTVANMKILYLFFNRLKQYYLKNKALFLLFFIGGMLNAVAVAYCYGNLLPAIANRYSQAEEYRDYVVRFDHFGYSTYEELEAAQAQGGEKPATVFPEASVVEAFASDPLLEACMLTSTDEKNIFACAGTYDFVTLSGVSEFSGPQQLLACSPAAAVTDLRVGDEVMLQGVPFEVIGVISYSTPGYFIPYDTFKAMGYIETVRFIEAYSVKRYDAANDPVYDLLCETFSNYTAVTQPDNHIVDASASELKLPGIVINAFISILAYVFLLRYLVDSLLDETIVCIIVGASKLQMTIHIFWEATLLSLGANCAGLLLHRLLYVPVFTKLNLSETLIYGLSDYMLLCLFMLVLSLFVTIPFVLKYLKLSPIEARREHA